MDVGVAVATSTESWKLVARAESLGFTHAWFYDTQLLNPDVFVGMALAAANTRSIRLGTGVLVPSNRIEAVTANALASLNRLAPGRIDFGVGTGFTARRTMGQRAIPLASLRGYVERVQALLRGESVAVPGTDGHDRIGFLNPELGLINLDDPVPLYVSALGSKSRRLTAELGAGWLNFAGSEDAAIKTLDDMRSAWREAGRAPDELYSNLFFLGAVQRPGEALDAPRIVAQAGPLVMVFFHNLVETTEPGSMEPIIGKGLSDRLEQYREVYMSYPARERHRYNHRGHLMFVREDERFLVTPDLIESMTFTGPVEELQERVARLREAGYRQLTIQIVEGQEDALEDWARVFGL